MATPNLALIPTGYKAGKVYSVLPETGVGDFEFTRASAATRINSNGLLEVPQYSIGSDVVTNGNFATDSDWTLGTATISGGLLNLSGGGGLSYAFQNNSNLVIGKTYLATYTVVSISNAGTGVRIRVGNGGNGVYRTTTGTFSEVITCSGSLEIFIEGNSTSFAGSIDNVSVIEQAINDVPRLEYPLIDGVVNGCPSLLLENQATNLITYPISFGNSYWTKSGATIEGDPSTAGSELVTNGDFTTDTDWTKGTGWTIGGGVASSDGTQAGTSALYQDCGIVLGKQYQVVYDVTSYTAGSVRIYLGGTSTGAVSRSATGTYTQQFSALGNQWVTIEADVNFIGSIDNVSVKEVQGYSSPSVDFPTSAFKLVEGTSTGTHVLEKNLGAPSGASFTWSIYAKKGEKDWIVINAYNGGSARVWFDLANGVLGTESGDAVGAIEELSNGWYKCSVTRPSNTIVIFNLGLAEANGSFSYTGDGTSGVYLFMGQLEAGSYATSPTLTSLSAEGTTTTRVAETCTGAGDASTFNDSEGVLMVEGSLLDVSQDGNRISISDGSSAENRITFRYLNDNEIQIELGLTNGFSETLNVGSSESFNKIAVVYNSTNASIFINGFNLVTDTMSSLSGLSQLQFNRFNSNTENFYGKTKQIQYFQTALTSAELETLTSWTSFTAMANAQQYNII